LERRLLTTLWRAGLVALAIVAGATTARAQIPSPSQAQAALQQNPGLGDMIRQRLQQSGMTPDQVRARLRAAGYPDSLLNAYLGPATSGQGQAGATPGVLELAAIQALGLPAVSGLSELPVDTGLVRIAAQSLRAESLAVGNYVFGVDVFRRSKTQFLPLLSGPVPPDYRVGPGDQLVLILTGDVEFAYPLQVTREGFILIPQVGQVYVANLTMEQVRDLLYTRLGRVYSGVRRGADATTRFDVSVANVRANQVYVVGEVTQPGAYQISALGTVLTSLYAAGGVTERANVRQIEVRRAGKVVDTLDLYDYLVRGDNRTDVRLESGDLVFVPVHGTRAQITGAVKRPAIYELKANEALPDLVRAAGGFRADAALKRIAVYRILSAGERSSASPARAMIDVSLTATARGRTSAGSAGDPPGDAASGVAMPALPLSDGDSVVVDSLPPLAGQYYVGIAGMVQKPDTYPWHQGMTLRDLVGAARGPLVGAYLKEAEIARLPADRSQGQLATTLRVPLDSTYLFERDSLGRYVGPPGLPFPSAGAPEVVLEPYDNVLILRQPDFAFQRTVVIVGEVRYPGTYSLRTKTDRLAELVGRAGGVTPQAYPEGVRFIRSLSHVGRVNVDLVKALKDTASASNVILQPGDSVEVPEYEPAVKVTGAVNSPGSVLWKKGEGLEYYIDAAGGFSYRAEKKQASVHYANGDVRTRSKTLLFTSDPEPGPGSEVFVPVKDTLSHTNWVTLAGALAQIVSSTLAIVVLAKQL